MTVVALIAAWIGTSIAACCAFSIIMRRARDRFQSGSQKSHNGRISTK